MKLKYSERKYEGSKTIDSARQVYDFFEPRLAHLTHEVFYTLWVNSKNKCLWFEKVAEGDESRVDFSFRKLFRYAFEGAADGMVCIHNHPSGKVVSVQPTASMHGA